MTDDERAARLARLAERQGRPRPAAAAAPSPAAAADPFLTSGAGSAASVPTAWRPSEPVQRPGRRRSHRAAAGRVLAAGASFSVMFGIVGALGATQSPTTAGAASATTAPAPSVVTVIRHLPAVAAGAPPPTTGGPAPQPAVAKSTPVAGQAVAASTARPATQVPTTSSPSAAARPAAVTVPATTIPPSPPTTAYTPPVTVAPTPVTTKPPVTRTGASHP
jgi:hypothetical protein